MCYQQKKLKNDIKRLYTLYNAWIYGMLEQGCLFYALTITLCSFYNDNTKENYFESEKEVREYFQKLMTFFALFPFIDCCLGSIEVSESGVNRAHFVIAFRSNFNCKTVIQTEIELLLSSSFEFYDYSLTYLNTYKDIIKAARYLSKDFTVARPFGYALFSIFSEILDFVHRPTMLDYFVEDSIEAIQLYTQVLYYDCGMRKDSLSNIPFGLYSSFHSIPKKLKGHIINEVVYFLGVYFQYKKIILIRDNYYIKIDNTLVSYKFFGDKSYIIAHFYSFMEELKSSVFNFLDLTLLSYIFSSKYEQIFEQISIILNFSSNKLNFDVLEFKDGLYVANQNIFYNKNEILEKNFNLLKSITIRYYDIMYKDLNEIEIPKTWKKKLHVNFTEKDFITFCTVFRNILFDNLIPTKKNILFLSGVSNSGKFRLILDIAIQSYGIQNTGFFVSGTNFLVENLLGKELAVFDEFIFKDNTYNILKALGSGKTLPVINKYQRNSYIKFTTKIIGVSNCNEEVKNLVEEDVSLKNRIHSFTFNTVCSISHQEYKEIINEIPFILVFCNKLYFKELKEFVLFN